MNPKAKLPATTSWDSIGKYFIYGAVVRVPTALFAGRICTALMKPFEKSPLAPWIRVLVNAAVATVINVWALLAAVLAFKGKSLEIAMMKEPEAVLKPAVIDVCKFSVPLQV